MTAGGAGTPASALATARCQGLMAYDSVAVVVEVLLPFQTGVRP